MRKNKNLTLYYTIHQFIYWAIPAGVASFATTYLLEHGYNNFSIGFILFGSCFFSFLFQPFLATYADKANKNVLPYLMFALAVLSILMFSSIYLFNLSAIAFAVVYMLGNVFVDMQLPLINSISMYYHLRKWKVNYALSRGLGALGFGIATFFYGEVILRFGSNIMPIICIGLLMIFGIMSLFYPKVQNVIETVNEKVDNGTSSMLSFIKKYKWYSLSSIAFMLFAIFHVMIENYLIVIMTSLGGTSADVGTALFLSTLVEIPTTVIFLKIYKKLGSRKIIIIGGIFYLIKAVLLLIADSLIMIYIAQLLQCVNYVFVCTVIVYYAKECTSSSDLVKSQSLLTALFSLGFALGNLAGGVLIDIIGIKMMILCGLIIVLIGLAVSFLTVKKAQEFGKTVQEH